MFKKVLLLLAILAFGFVGYAYRDHAATLLSAIEGNSSPPSAAAPSTPTPSAVPTPGVRERLVALDPTTSTDASFKDAVKEDLVRAVETYVPPKPSTTTAGAAAVPALHLVVRLVGTSPLAYGQPGTEIRIPAVAALPPQPDMGASGALDPQGPYSKWTALEKDWSVQYDAALAAAKTAGAELQKMAFDTRQSSAVMSTVAELALLAPADGDVKLLVASDLDNNMPVQSTSSLHGHPLVVIQPNPSGDSAAAGRLYSTFAAWASGQGAGPLTRTVPEQAPATIDSFLKGN